MYLARLPWACVMLCLAAVALAIPATSAAKSFVPELTASDFETSVATRSSGLWWIKFYSPYCHHCVGFAPIWEALAAEPVQNVSMGSVNCVAQGDLCTRLGVQLYPTIVLYKDGLEVDTVKGALSKKFMKKYIHEQIDLLEKESLAASTADPLFKHGDTNDVAVINPRGVSVDLTQEEFKRRVTSTRNSWFIQFYSQQSTQSHDIRAAWTQLAQQAQGRLNIGEVDCDKQKQLCKDVGVLPNLPTLKYFASAIHSEYKGLRGLGDLLQFLERAIEARAPREITLKDLNELRSPDTGDADVTLVFLYDSTTAKEDFQALEKLAVSIVGTVCVARSRDPRVAAALGARTTPALFAVSADKVVEYAARSPQELRDHTKLVAWAVRNRAPLVPQITPFNYKDIFERPEMLVLGIFDPREQEVTAAAITELKGVARSLQQILDGEEAKELHELRKKKQRKIDEVRVKNDKKGEEYANQIKVEVVHREPVGVAWMDAVFWERWVKRRYGTPPEPFKPRIIINHESSGNFWENTVTGTPIPPSRSSIVDTIRLVLHPIPKLRVSRIHNATFRTWLVRTIREHGLFVFIFATTVVWAYLYWRRRLARAGSGGSGTPGSVGLGLIGKFD